MEKKIGKVKHIYQCEKYPTGCEIISTIMNLLYLNIIITPEEFIDNYLEKGDYIKKDNQYYTPSPFDKFVGSPYNDNSFGCYEPVIEKALIKLFSEKNLNFEVKNLNNVPMDIIIKDYIDKDIPVIFWATMDLKQTKDTRQWIVPETGEKYTWKAYEHCLLLVGYNNEENNYYFHDPLKKEGPIPYNKEIVEKRHKEQFSNACAIVKKN